MPPACGGWPAALRDRREARERVADEVGLPITVGVAGRSSWRRWRAASRKPDGLLVVDPDRELEFLHPLPVERLWGVGAVTAAKLDDRGVFTVGEVAAMDQEVFDGDRRPQHRPPARSARQQS